MQRLHRGPVGRTWSGAPLPVEILSGGLVYWAFREMYKIRHWKREDLCIAAALGNLDGEGGGLVLPGTLRDR
jgi:hypothetical protein